MFSFRNSRQPTNHDADGYRAGELDGKAAPLSPGIAVAATVFVQIQDWSRNCLTSLLVGHNMRDVPSAKAAIRRLERGRDKTAGTRCISEDVKPRMRPGVPPRCSWKMGIFALSMAAMFAGPLRAQNAGLDANEVIRKAQAAIGGASVHSIQVIGVGTGCLAKPSNPISFGRN